MLQGLLVEKIGMKQTFDLEGQIVPVTILKALDNVVAQIKTKERDGYEAVQIAAVKRKKINKPLAGHLKKAGISQPLKLLIEVKAEALDKISLGEQVRVEDVFEEGELIKITGRSKGRGFTGVIKRWGFSSQPKTHGQSDRERAPGSIGSQTPGRVIKGKKMPGHHGFRQVSVSNLLLAKVDPARQEMWVKGAVPGPVKGFLLALKTGKRRKQFIQLQPGARKNEKNEQ